MVDKFLVTIALSLPFAAAALVVTPGNSSAAQGSAMGTVVAYNLNTAVPNRGACIRTEPALPDNGWACVYNNLPLYNELNSLLKDAWINGAPCTIDWSKTDPNGNAIIELAECD